MPPDQAVADTLRDICLHELASPVAMQAAVRALLRDLDPATILAGEGSGLPGQRKARAWDAYAALHARMDAGLIDNFDHVFGQTFARAYEQAVREAQERDTEARLSARRSGTARRGVGSRGRGEA